MKNTWDKYNVDSSNMKYVLGLLEDAMEEKDLNKGKAFLGVVDGKAIYVEIIPNTGIRPDELELPPVFSQGTITEERV